MKRFLSFLFRRRFRDLPVIVTRVSPSTLEMLERAMHELDPYTKKESEENRASGANSWPIGSAWSALHTIHTMLNMAMVERKFVKLCLRKRFYLRIGRAHRLTISVGYRYRAKTMQKIVYVGLWGRIVDFPITRRRPG